jgi:hypothetical protein
MGARVSLIANTSLVFTLGCAALVGVDEWQVDPGATDP